MKSVAIVTDHATKSSKTSSVAHILKTNLEEVFSDHIIINNYHIDELTLDKMINDDIVIAMASSRAMKIRKYVKHPNNIIVAQRTFLKSNVNQLFSIPKNTDVLVVNDDIETVLNSVSSLYDIGVKHLNLIPYEFGKEYHNIDVAVSPSEPEIIPKNIKTFIDIGHRVLDITTMLLIINMLNINDKSIHKNLYNYYQKNFSTNRGIEENYSNLLTRTEILDHLLDLSNDGILLTSREGRILIYNAKFKEIFDLKRDISGKYLHEAINGFNFMQYYNSETQDDLIFYQNKYIALQKENLTYFDNIDKMHFTFQEVTYIKKIEQNLSNKLRQKGHIAKYTFESIITQSPVMFNLIKIGKKISKSDINILITGETGTGKEVFAQAIHNFSTRNNQPFVAINCAAMPENLLESELFGYVSGSFTGALKGGKKGLFEVANNGTIFLDEIGDMPYHLQSKLIRVLQEKQVMPIGSDRMVNIDVRIISATNKNLSEMMKNDLFRKDLFYRLNTFPIKIPPLRNRTEDIRVLIDYFSNSRHKLSKECLDLLLLYSWPGNVRELENVVSYLYAFEDNGIIDSSSLPEYIHEVIIENAVPIEKRKENSSIYQKDVRLIEEKSTLSSAIIILRTIEYLNEIKKTAGRKHILENLKKDNNYINESKLKTVLKLLSDIGFIATKNGRRGSFVLEKGKDFLINI